METEALTPTVPQMTDQQELQSPEAEQADREALAADRVVANVIHQPNWAEVERYFLQTIAEYRDVRSLDPKLPTDEYKINGLSKAAVADELETLLNYIYTKVNAVEVAEARAMNEGSNGTGAN